MGGGETVFSFQKERKLLIEFLSFSNLLLSWHGVTWEVINSGKDCVAAFQPASGNLKQTSGVCLQWRERAREKERWKGTSVSHESPAISPAPSAQTPSVCVSHKCNRLLDLKSPVAQLHEFTGRLGLTL